MYINLYINKYKYTYILCVRLCECNINIYLETDIKFAQLEMSYMVEPMSMILL